MACKNICKLCDKLILSTAVTFTAGNLVVALPAGTYRDGEKYCIVIAQAIDGNATINAPVVARIGTPTTLYPITNDDGVQLTASVLRTRTRYATRVYTTATGGSFRLMGHLCQANNNLDAISG